jgi:peptidoglycan/LPS O-acetylase OafA/YrhL
MAELSGSANTDRPPVAVRLAVVILVVVACIEFVLCISEFIANFGNDDPTGTQSGQAGALCGLGLACAWVARLVWRGYRGGLVLAILVGVFVTCLGAGATSAPFPFNILAAVPLLGGVAIILLLVVPAASRAWFRPRR